MTVSLYLHVPFCRSRCTYCDFVTWTGREAALLPWVDRARREIEWWGRITGRDTVPTVFLGGGTPSLLPGFALAQLLDTIRASFRLDPGAEISLEANPGSVTPDLAAAWATAGVTRVSLGAQTFDDARLRLLGRLHGAAGVQTAVRTLRNAGLHNLSIDLIYGLPGQDVPAWQRDVDAALALETPHVSAYGLTVEKGTPLARQVERGLEVPDGDTLATMYELADDRFTAAGLANYEISNWARPGSECRHNLVYWENRPFLGIGPGAWSCWDGTRFGGVPDLDQWLEAELPYPPPVLPLPGLHEADDAGPAMAARETAMLQLRLAGGLDLAAFRRHHGDMVTDEIARTLGEFAPYGLLDRQGDVVRLTRKGRLLSNEVFSRIVAP